MLDVPLAWQATRPPGSSGPCVQGVGCLCDDLASQSSVKTGDRQDVLLVGECPDNCAAAVLEGDWGSALQFTLA